LFLLETSPSLALTVNSLAQHFDCQLERSQAHQVITVFLCIANSIDLQCHAAFTAWLKSIVIFISFFFRKTNLDKFFCVRDKMFRVLDNEIAFTPIATRILLTVICFSSITDRCCIEMGKKKEMQDDLLISKQIRRYS
jgi:hypothetical protein